MDCFYEGENMLVIHPDECIDCGVCEPECPVDAIKPDTEPGLEKLAEAERRFRENLAEHHGQEASPADAKDGKVCLTSREVLSPEPGQGD